MIASDSAKGKKKMKRSSSLAIQKPLENIRKIFQEKDSLASISAQDIKPIIVEEVIPKEEETKNFIHLINQPFTLEQPSIREIKKDDNKKEQYLKKQEPEFVELEKIEMTNYEREPQEIERLIEYKKIIEEKQIILPKIESIQFDFTPEQLGPERIPEEMVIEVKEKQLVQPSKIKEINQVPLKINFENIEPIKIYPFEKIPTEVIFVLEEKKMFILPSLYFENMEKMEVKTTLFEPLPSLMEIKLTEKVLGIKEEIEKSQKLKISLQKKSIFDIPEIERYFEIGEKEKIEERIEERKKEPSIDLEINKQILLEYKKFFYRYTNPTINFQNIQLNYETNEQLENYYKAKELEEQYWKITENRNDPKYEKQKEKFLSSLKKCNEEQGKLTEQMIVTTKAIGLLRIISEEKNEEVSLQASKFYNEILERYPKIKHLVEYEFSKYVFVKTFKEERIGPSEKIMTITKDLPTELKTMCYAQWASFLDEIIKEKETSKSLKILCGQEYSKLIINNPGIDEKIKRINAIKKAIKIGVVDPILKDIVFYEIAFFVYNKRREKNG